MKIILHVGWHKTGSTAIQTYLYKHRHALLERFHILYPETGRLTVAHHRIAWSLHEPLQDPWALSLGLDESCDELFEALLQEATASGAPTLLISSEDFVFADKQKAGALLKDYDVQLIVYLRRQDRAIESFYGQGVRQFEHRLSIDFEDYLAELGTGLNYAQFLDAWAHALPNAAITPRVYDRMKFPNENVVADFLATIGVDMPSVSGSRDADANVSLDPLSIRALARINHAFQLTKERHEGVVALLRQIDAAEQPMTSGFFRGSGRFEFLQHFSASNDVLFHRWFGTRNGFDLSADEMARDAAADTVTADLAEERRYREACKYLEGAPQAAGAETSIERRSTDTAGANAKSADGADDFRDLALAAIARGDWTKALELLLVAHRLRPAGPFIRLQLARVLVELGRMADARPHVDVVGKEMDFPGREPLLTTLRAKIDAETEVPLRDTAHGSSDEPVE